MSEILVLAEHDRGVLDPATFEALTFARSLADEIVVLVCGDHDLADELAVYGATAVHVADHELLNDDFGPEAWGQTLAERIESESPDLVIACGTSKGNEVMAQAAARLDVPFVANCLDIDDDGTEMTRVQWGGSLLERAALDADVKLVSVAHHAVEASPAEDRPDVEVSTFEPDLDESLARTVVVGREMAESGVTLATAPVVVGGGRATGGPEGFVPLEELAALLGGRVGCSRAVTNNGWRPHSDQVGQTGTRIAPELYIANGISGAIQHWVGAMASKKILAINTDPEANMVVKADYCVIGDLHEVIPAVIAEVKARRGS
jgi:electron transfer flavoprotein alpha subunit